VTSAVEWCGDAGVVLGRGLLAGSLTGGGLGVALGSVFAFPIGTVLGLVLGTLAGFLPAMFAAPALAVVHGSVTTDRGARGMAVLVSVLAMEVWAFVLDTDLSTHVAWGVTGAVVGVVVGPWVVFGPKPARTGREDRR
jgi:hypothetical protein